ncbi:MAG: hypothetical protein GQ565_07810 [Candidatus Aegiribacteria sp.]|nr:hypothetical protein [Candidatus Aegiribacteria sp.]
MSSELPVLDRSVLRSSLGDDQQLIEEILELFQTTTSDIIESLEKAAYEGDLETVRKTAHSIKGSAANISAKAMQESMKDIEAACAKEDREAVSERVRDSIREYNRLKLEIGR